MIEFKMPSLGADMESGTLIEWFVKPGDMVHSGDIVAQVDTQKGLIDIEVFEEGRIEQLLIRETEKVPVGTILALIASEKEEPEKAHAASPPPTEVPTPAPGKIVPPEPEVHIRATPLAKRIAKEKGIDIFRLQGTGEQGAITREDVEKALSIKEEPIKAEKAPATEQIRMAIAAAMSRSNQEIPHYYLQTRIDMRAGLIWLQEANKKRKVTQRLLPAVLLLKAVAAGLVKEPRLNGYWENGPVPKDRINVGFVIALRTGGLVIPAIHDADKKNLDQVMEWINDIIPRSRSFKLRSSDLTDATITVTSLGENNAETVFGVIYPPQVALVGFGTITEQPWAENGSLSTRPVLTATLAADHRASDAQTGSRFLMAIKNYLENSSGYE